MYLIFVLPLAMSLCAVLLALYWDFAPFTKWAIIVLVTAAAAMQFIPALQQSIHFLVPLFVQLFACAWCFFAARPY